MRTSCRGRPATARPPPRDRPHICNKLQNAPSKSASVFFNWTRSVYPIRSTSYVWFCYLFLFLFVCPGLASSAGTENTIPRGFNASAHVYYVNIHDALSVAWRPSRLSSDATPTPSHHYVFACWNLPLFPVTLSACSFSSVSQFVALYPHSSPCPRQSHYHFNSITPHRKPIHTSHSHSYPFLRMHALILRAAVSHFIKPLVYKITPTFNTLVANHPSSPLHPLISLVSCPFCVASTFDVVLFRLVSPSVLSFSPTLRVSPFVSLHLSVCPCVSPYRQ